MFGSQTHSYFFGPMPTMVASSPKVGFYWVFVLIGSLFPSCLLYCFLLRSWEET
ncbi:Uncharacterized protein TCM_023490 [Theobroma cacao]|uniref:Uncharacterized protein n=1 Tax=Theobroma cacao TaxID=3641 RepID=A0A061EV07_THECC|nr:Uncharacterized protein TCM_023490 [Theobroma cacao]